MPCVAVVVAVVVAAFVAVDALVVCAIAVVVGGVLALPTLTVLQVLLLILHVHLHDNKNSIHSNNYISNDNYDNKNSNHIPSSEIHYAVFARMDWRLRLHYGSTTSHTDDWAHTCTSKHPF